MKETNDSIFLVSPYNQFRLFRCQSEAQMARRLLLSFTPKEENSYSVREMRRGRESYAK